MRFKEILLEALLLDDLYLLGKTLGEELQSPINITDEAYNILVQYPKEKLDDIIWDTYLTQGTLGVELINLLDKHKLIEKGFVSNKPYVIMYEQLGKYPRVTSKIAYNKQILGYLTVYSTEGNVSEEMLEKIEIATKVIGFQMKQKYNSETLVSNRTDVFLANLLSGSIYNRKELEDWMAASSLELTENYFLICASCENTNKQSLLISILKELKLESSLCTIHKGAIYIFIDNVKTNKPSKTFEKIIQILKSYQLQIGISQEYVDLLETPKAKKQSNFAMKKARKGEILYFMDIGLSLLAEEVVHKTGDFYIHSGLKKLKDFDIKNKTEYYKTLVCFLENEGNHQLVEKTLKIHRNTVYNRIRAIEDYLGIDLSDAYTFTYLYISYLMLCECEK